MNTRLFVKRNASSILTGLGSIGVVTTAIMAVKATPKSYSINRRSRKRERRRINKMGESQNSKIKLYSFSYCRYSDNNLFTSLKYS